MKFQLSFLKGISIVCLSIFLLFFNCSTDVYAQTDNTQEPLTDVLTLELSFGADESILKSEYLLAIPNPDIWVNTEGDIFVLDETCVKVYDKNGVGKRIIGGPGRGPGEFSAQRNRINFPTISPSGYLTVVDATEKLNIYKPDYEFLKFVWVRNRPFYTKLRDEKSWNLAAFWKAFTIDESKSIFDLAGSSGSIKIITGMGNISRTGDLRLLIYERNDFFIEIASYDECMLLNSYGLVEKFDGVLLTNPYLGILLWDMLPDNRIIYTQGETDKRRESDDSLYLLHVFSPENLASTSIEHKYVPVKIPDDEKKEKFYGYTSATTKSITHYAPLQALLSDGYYVFAITFQQNNAGEYLVDIFDLEQNTYIKSVNFSIVPNIIKNRKAYRVATNDDGFYIIEKYRIDPAVYGK